MAGGVVNQPALLDMPRPHRQVRAAGGTDVTVGDGGTGVSSLTDGGVLVGSGSNAVTVLARLTNNQLMVGQSAGDPVNESGATLRTSIGLGTGSTVAFSVLTLTTDLAVAHGGTGASSHTDGGLLIGKGASAIENTGVLADGELVVGDGTTNPVLESGATLRTSIGVGAADAVSFAAITSVAANDGADTALIIRNSATSGSVDETVSLLFQHVDANGPGGKIVSARVSDYSSDANEDSTLGFYNGKDGADELRILIAANGLVTIATLSGSGSRTVVASSTGVLSAP